MIINESYIRQIVSETVSQLMLEFDMGGAIGRNGPLTVSNMIDPSVEFAEEIEKLTELRKKHAVRTVNVEEVFGQTKAYKIWSNYNKAMGSKGDKKPIKFLLWLNFVCFGKKGQKIMAYAVDDNYMFGYWIHGYFLAAYFAPLGYTGMAKLIKGLCQYNNIIFAVTEDLAPMLERLGVPKSFRTHKAPYRGGLVDKIVFGTSKKAILYGIKILFVARKFHK